MAPGLQDAGPTCRPAAAQLATQFRSGRWDADALYQRPAAKPDAVANDTARAGIEAVDPVTIAVACAGQPQAAAAGFEQAYPGWSQARSGISCERQRRITLALHPTYAYLILFDRYIRLQTARRRADETHRHHLPWPRPGARGGVGAASAALRQP